MAATAVVAALAVLTTACGDDADEADSTTTEAPAEADNASTTAFCDAELEVEKAFASEGELDPTAALQTIEENIPEGSEDAVTAMLDEAKKALESPEGPGEEFNAAYVDYLEVVREHCGFGEIEATLKDYEFVGIPDEVDAGGTIITVENEGTEAHEMVVLRINDDTTESVDEILALPQEEALKKVTMAGVAFAMPGETGGTVSDLEPGKYVAACFVPVGTTPEAMAAMESGGAEPQGEPHFLHGMVQEFTVS